MGCIMDHSTRLDGWIARELITEQQDVCMEAGHSDRETLAITTKILIVTHLEHALVHRAIREGEGA